jgi:hypothetical protein
LLSLLYEPEGHTGGMPSMPGEGGGKKRPVLVGAMLLTVQQESVMVIMPVLSPHGHSDHIIKGGKTTAGHQRS